MAIGVEDHQAGQPAATVLNERPTVMPAPKLAVRAPVLDTVSAVPPQLRESGMQVPSENDATDSTNPNSPKESPTSIYISGKTTEQIKAEIRESAIKLHEERVKHLKVGDLTLKNGEYRSPEDNPANKAKTKLEGVIQSFLQGLRPRVARDRVGLEMQRDVTAMGVLEEQIAFYRESHHGAMPDVTDLDFIRHVSSTDNKIRLEGRQAWKNINNGTSNKWVSMELLAEVPGGNVLQESIKSQVLLPLITKLKNTPLTERKALVDHWKQYGMPKEISTSLGGLLTGQQGELGEVLNGYALDTGAYASTLVQAAERMVSDSGNYKAALDAMDINIGYVQTQFDKAGFGTNAKDFLRHRLARPVGRAIDVGAWVLRNGKTAVALGAAGAAIALGSTIGAPILLAAGGVAAGVGLLAQGIKSFNAIRADRMQMESRMAKGVDYATRKEQIQAKQPETVLGRLNPFRIGNIGTRMSREFQQARMAEVGGKHIVSADALYFGQEITNSITNEIVQEMSLDGLITSVDSAQSLSDLQTAIDRVAQIKARQQLAATTGRRFISSGEVSELELLAKQIELENAIKAQAETFTTDTIVEDKIAIAQSDSQKSLQSQIKSDNRKMIGVYVQRIALNMATRAGAVGAGFQAARMFGEHAINFADHAINSAEHAKVPNLFSGLGQELSRGPSPTELLKGAQEKWNELTQGTSVHKLITVKAGPSTEGSVGYDQYVADHGLKVNPNVDQNVPDNAQYAYGTTDYAGPDGGIIVKGYGDIGDRADGIMATVKDSTGGTHTVILEFDKNHELLINPNDTIHTVNILKPDGTTEIITSADAAKLLNVTQQGLDNWHNATPPDVSTDWDYQYGQAVFGEKLQMVSFSHDAAGHAILNSDKSIDATILSTVRGHGGIDTNTSLNELIAGKDITSNITTYQNSALNAFLHDPSNMFLKVGAVVGLGTAARIAVDLRRQRYYPNEKTANTVITGGMGIVGGVFGGPAGALGAMALTQAGIRWANSGARNAAKTSAVELSKPVVIEGKNTPKPTPTSPEDTQTNDVVANEVELPEEIKSENDHSVEKEQVKKINEYLLLSDNYEKLKDDPNISEEQKENARLALVNGRQQLPQEILEDPQINQIRNTLEALAVLSFLSQKNPTLSPILEKIKAGSQPSEVEGKVIDALTAYRENVDQQNTFSISPEAREAQEKIAKLYTNIAQQEKQRLEAILNVANPVLEKVAEQDAKSLGAIVAAGKAYEIAKEAKDEAASAEALRKFNKLLNDAPEELAKAIYDDPSLDEVGKKLTQLDNEIVSDALNNVGEASQASKEDLDAVWEFLHSDDEMSLTEEQGKLYEKVQAIIRSDARRSQMEYESTVSLTSVAQKLLQNAQQTDALDGHILTENLREAVKITPATPEELAMYTLPDSINVAKVLSQTELTSQLELVVSANKSIEKLSGEAIVTLPHPEIPVRFVGDVHARPDYVFVTLNEEFELPDGSKIPLIEAVKQGQAQIIFGGDLLHSEEGVMALESTEGLLMQDTAGTGTILYKNDGNALFNVYTATRRANFLRGRGYDDAHIRNDLGTERFPEGVVDRALTLSLDGAYTETLNHLNLPENASLEELRKFFLEVELRHTANVMQTIMELKAAYPDYVQVLLGTHDQFVYGVEKGVNQSAVFTEMVQASGYQEFAQKLKEWSEKLPYFVVGGNAVWSHTIPGTVEKDGADFDGLTREEIVNRSERALRGVTLHRTSDDYNRNGEPQILHLLSVLGVSGTQFWFNGHDDQGIEGVREVRVDGIKRVIVDSSKQLAYVDYYPGTTPDYKKYALQRNAGRELINAVRAAA